MSQKWCAEVDYTAQHEWGHNLGAHHNVEAIGKYDDYNVGYMIPDTKKATIMS